MVVRQPAASGGDQEKIGVQNLENLPIDEAKPRGAKGVCLQIRSKGAVVH
jgi:hypothetical protein